MMSDDVSDEDRPQHRELHPLLFSNSVWVGLLQDQPWLSILERCPTYREYEVMWQQ